MAGARELKKVELRRQLTDTATRMFIERGFDAVRVSDIATACGVTEKTVFNHFPTKESLLLDTWEATELALEAALLDAGTTPLAAAKSVLQADLAGVSNWLLASDDPADARRSMRAFAALLDSTPALRAHRNTLREALIDRAADALARRSGSVEPDPATRATAIALVGLWDIQSRSLSRNLAGPVANEGLGAAVAADVDAAAAALARGIA